MSEFRGTQGPYRVVKSGRNSLYAAYVLGPGEDQAVAGVFTDADAHLLAASWEMYEALQFLVAFAEEGGHGEGWTLGMVRQKARAAIAKALGEQP